MDSSSGILSNSSDSGTGDGTRVFGSEEDLRQMEQKKRKRMISNRESARRSRLRKQSHVNSLMALAAQLREEKSQILGGLHVTTQLNLRVEAENGILLAQAAELSHRLQSLNEIASCLSHGAGGSFMLAEEPTLYMAESVGFMNYMCLDQSQPIFIAADVGGFQQ